MGDHFPGPGNMVETVAHVVRDFDAMAAECGGLEAATIHAMTVRLSVAHAREVEALRLRAEAAEADARRYSFLAHKCNHGDEYGATEIRFSSALLPDAAIDAAIASRGEDRKA